MAIVTPLYGHTSAETGYVVPDYPYGRLRCQITYWLESDPKKGFRFVSQTVNPKNGRINAPKKSVYSLIAGCMYLDEKGHCHWTGLTEYGGAKEVTNFVMNCPGAVTEKVRVWVAKKISYYKRCSTGELVWRINSDATPATDEEKAEAERDLCDWQAVATLLGAGK